MGKAATKAKNKYNAENYERISLNVPKGEKDKIREHAEANGESVNGFINRAIKEAIERENLEAEIESFSYKEYLKSVKGIIERNKSEREKRKRDKEKGLE